MSRIQKYIAFTLYILGVAVFFLYILFPSDTLKTYMEYKAAEISPDIGLHVEKLNPGLPPGLLFSNTHILFMNESVIRLDKVRLTPSIVSILTANPAVNVAAAVSGGRLEGKLSRKISQNGRGVNARVQFSEIELEGITMLEKLYPARFSGTAQGQIDYGAEKGNAALTVSGFRMDFDDSIMGIGHLEFTSIDAISEIENGRMAIERVEMKGPQFSATGYGSLTLRHPFEASRIELSGTIDVHPQLIRTVGALLPRQYMRDGKIPLRITGTLANPQYSFR